jgi:endonuclease VIII
MPEGHTLHALAGRVHHAFAGTTVAASSPQGRFQDGAALLDGLVMLEASAWGKHLFVEFGGDAWLHVHLGLIGKMSVQQHRRRTDPGVPPHEVAVKGAVRLRLLNDTYVSDLRGPNLCAVVTPEEIESVHSRLGPDPLRPGADPEVAWRTIHRSRRPIGELLMDQAVLAGIGNVYRAEVLFRHAVHPLRPGRTLRVGRWRELWADLVVLLGEGVRTGRIDTVRPEHTPEAMGRPPRVDDHGGEVYVYRRTGQPCLVCGTAVRTDVLVGRNVFWCPRCQRAFRSRALQ